MSNSNTTAPLERPVPLPLEFKHKSFGYRQLERNEKAAIYSQSAGDQIAAYEVVKIRTVKFTIWMGKEIPFREVYPSDNHWGSRGWTYRTLGEAKIKMEVISGGISPPATR
jgi:hypothetical protein